MLKNLFRPYDDKQVLGCSCGKHANESECQRSHQSLLDANRATDAELVGADFIEAAAVKALFPHDAKRRAFLKAVGQSTAMAAIATVLPIGALQSMAAETKTVGNIEKKNLKLGFIPITCATPLIMADPMGFYAEQGLKVNLTKVAGWALVRDRMLNHELDASHFLAPMPFTITMGKGSAQQNMKLAALQNINGQALTMSMKHINNRDPKNWKGMVFAIPFVHSMHNYLLRYFLAEHGINPDTDVQLRVTSPPEMVANLLAGNIDGFFGPEPFNQRAIYEKAGYIHTLSKDIWDGHPCCAFGTSEAFIQQNPNTFLALYRAILKSTVEANKGENRQQIAKVISTAGYLNQPEIVVRQVLTGHFADGDGHILNVPNRTGYDAMPWYSMGVWMLTQMRRWGYINSHINYQDLTEKVMMLTDAKRQMAQLGLDYPHHDDYQGFSVMGKPFDPRQPEQYVNQFTIKKLV